VSDYETAAKLRAAAAEDRKRLDACLLLAGFKVHHVHELVNGYHGWWDTLAVPWYLFETDVGLIKIGWRKRVINISWDRTGLRWERPVDPDVTRGDDYCHAYGYDKTLEYLKLLRPELVAHAKAAP
jgi:hypothetical protein